MENRKQCDQLESASSYAMRHNKHRHAVISLIMSMGQHGVSDRGSKRTVAGSSKRGRSSRSETQPSDWERWDV